MKEGLVEKAELASGVYLAESLVKVNNGQVITSVLNTRDEDVEISITELELREQNNSNVNEVLTVGLTERGTTKGNTSLSRGEQVISRLRTDHLNKEEKRTLQEICFDYQDVFYLPGDKLSSTNAARHTIHLEPGTTPINTRPYRLPESQKNEIDRQVEQLLREDIIVKSNSPWNSPLLVVPKKVGPDGKQKWRMVVDFRKVNEKTIGTPTRYRTLPKY